MNTYILEFSSGEHHVVSCNDIDKYVKNCVKKCNRGFFHQKRNKTAKVIFFTEGKYDVNIRLFGVRKFLMMVKEYDPLVDGVLQNAHKRIVL